MPGRPIKKRTAVSYARDAEAITRLRTAIFLDSTVNTKLKKKALDVLDDAVQVIVEIRDSNPTQE